MVVHRGGFESQSSEEQAVRLREDLMDVSQSSVLHLRRELHGYTSRQHRAASRWP